MQAALLLAFALTMDPPSVSKAFMIDGVKREAIIYPNSKPASDVGAPLVFAFHGHGGTIAGTARRFNLQGHWPDAVVVYMQGLPSKGITDPEGKKPGWQKNAGELDDRDLKFFDAVLKRVKKDYKIDLARIYATGHSNGGAFTYLLWSERADVFAAFAPTAALFGPKGAKAEPKPALVIAGEKDEIVPFANQQRNIEFLRRLDHSQGAGVEWSKTCTLYKPASDGEDLVTWVHPGGHALPDESFDSIVKFFKEHRKRSIPATEECVACAGE